jgi:hypothetical protein
MATTQERHEARAADERLALLSQAVAEETEHGWKVDADSDYRAVLAGHNRFRTVLARRRLGIRSRHKLVDVDKRGKVSIKRF